MGGAAGKPHPCIVLQINSCFLLASEAGTGKAPQRIWMRDALREWLSARKNAIERNVRWHLCGQERLRCRLLIRPLNADLVSHPFRDETCERDWGTVIPFEGRIHWTCPQTCFGGKGGDLWPPTLSAMKLPKGWGTGGVLARGGLRRACCWLTDRIGFPPFRR